MFLGKISLVSAFHLVFQVDNLYFLSNSWVHLRFFEIFNQNIFIFKDMLKYVWVRWFLEFALK